MPPGMKSLLYSILSIHTHTHTHVKARAGNRHVQQARTHARMQQHPPTHKTQDTRVKPPTPLDHLPHLAPFNHEPDRPSTSSSHMQVSVFSITVWTSTPGWLCLSTRGATHCSTMRSQQVKSRRCSNHDSSMWMRRTRFAYMELLIVY